MDKSTFEIKVYGPKWATIIDREFTGLTAEEAEMVEEMIVNRCEAAGNEIWGSESIMRHTVIRNVRKGGK